MKTEHYELVVIFPGALTDEEVMPSKQAIKKLIVDHSGTITHEEDMGRLKFAYPVSKQSHGNYYLYEFNMATSDVKEVEKILRITKEVVRHMLVKYKVKSEVELRRDQKIQEKIAKRKKDQHEKEEKALTPKKKKAPVSQKKEPKENVNIEELDKKLDEILEGETII